MEMMAGEPPVVAGVPVAMPVASGAGVGGASGFHTLGAVDGVFVKQKIELLEVLTGCETENKYEVWARNADDTRAGSAPLFRAKEKSNCLARQCCGPKRPFTMNITDGTGTDFMVLRRPFKCTFFCFNRDEVVVESGAGEGLAYLRNPWALFDSIIEVGPPPVRDDVKPLPIIEADGNNKPWYTVTGSCCQLGMFCHAPCGPCKEVVWNIVPAEGGEPVGHIKKVWSGCCKEAFTDADNFSVEFPAGATPYQKAALVATAFLIDFLYFEEKAQNQNHSG